MQIVKLSQSADREAWLEERRGLVTGTKAKGIKPLSRGLDRRPAGLWELLAEKLAIQPDGEKDIDRGQRLQIEALEKVSKKYKLDLDTDPGFWISDSDQNIAVSPDGAEPGDKPIYAAEAKCLASKNHLKAIVKDIQAKQLPDYNPFDSLCIDSQNDHKDQVLQHFLVNDDLKRVYFALYDDRIALDNLLLYVIIVERKHVEDMLEEQLTIEKNALDQVEELIKVLKNV